MHRQQDIGLPVGIACVCCVCSSPLKRGPESMKS